jgi:predicted ArsR family transcriptional regulator
MTQGVRVDDKIVLDYLKKNPQAPPIQVAEAVGISAATARIIMERNDVWNGARGPNKRSEPVRRDVGEFVQRFIEDNGWAPSITEIAEGVGTSRSNAHRTLQMLQASGLIEVGPYPRQIRMVRMKAVTEEL